MEFRPFWELLEELGIDLPDPSRIKAQENRKPIEPPPPPPSATQSRDRVLQYLGELIEDCTIAGRNAWVPADQTVQVGNYSLPGLVYVGNGLMSLRSYTHVEPCLIRPKLKIDCPHPDYAGKQMHYSPSYQEMKPASRAAYLEWLSQGRRTPKTYIGYVWLFFYGLERRVLYDLLKTDFKNASVLQELDHIITEVEQLLDLYGDRQSAAGSFAHKAAMFLTICRALRSSNSPNNDPLADTICPTEASSLSLQIGLGQKIRQSQPIAADWALAWYTKIAKKQLRLVVTRCLDEFQTLFNIRYEQRFGKGIKLDAGQTSLRVEYLPTNHSFGRSLWLKFSHLADVNQCAGKLFQISEVVEACTIELEPLGRLLGRDPKAAKTPAAIALLPAVLLPTHGGKFAHNLQQWLTQTLSDAQTRLVTGAELLQYWSGANPEKLTKLEAIGLSKFLEQLGYGIEPDPRFGGALPTIQTKIALFRLSGQNPESLSSEYFETTLVAHLAIAIVNSDPALNSQKQHNLESRLTTFTTLKSSEQQRFYAHLKWLTQQKPALRNLKTRIDAVNPDRKPTIARFLAQIATADGQPHPKAIQPLEKAYSLLGLATQTVYSDLHDVATTALYEPITVRNAAPMRGHSLPSPDLALDMTLVQSKLEASQEIAHLLAEIFVDEDPSIVPQPAIPQPSEHKTSEHKTSDHKIPGLDAAHTAFLLTLAQQTTWTRPQLMTIATPLNLMLDGALELINELAFDRCNEPLIEGDNSLDVNAEVLQELLR